MIGDEQATKDRLAERFDLTSAEAELASAFLREGSLRAAAEHRGLTDGTARQYLKRIFRKTGTNSQVKLMKLLVLTLLGRAPAGSDTAG
jgi:DNA-binding CsgD family transcriptional regulator